MWVCPFVHVICLLYYICLSMPPFLYFRVYLFVPVLDLVYVSLPVLVSFVCLSVRM